MRVASPNANKTGKTSSMLVGVEEDGDIPVGCLEDARDEEDLREPESHREVNQGTQTALEDGDNVLPRFEQRCQARPNSDGGRGTVHALASASPLSVQEIMQKNDHGGETR